MFRNFASATEHAAAVRIHGDIVDETVGQTDLLGLGQKRQEQQDGKEGQSAHRESS